MTGRRVAISGMGIVCSAGNDVATVAGRVKNGVSALSPISNLQVAHLIAKYAGMARDFNAPALEALLKTGRKLDRYVLFSLHAARQAMTDAGLLRLDQPARSGIVFATCSGPMQTIEEYYAAGLKAEPPGNAAALFSRRYFSAARILGHLFGCSGVNVTVTTACSASINALGLAADLIALGDLDVVLVGGADSFSLTTLAGFDGLRATTAGTCAPFSKPIGMNLGEGSGFVVLESFESARRRSAQIHAEVLGYGSSNDAYHATAPDPTGRGQALAMTRALSNAGIGTGDIGYINAHGTGTEANDKAEVKAVKRLFGDGNEPPMSSSKPIFGHCLGAAGMVELIGSIACGSEGALPPTANYAGAREGCAIDVVPAPGRPWPGKPFLKNNFAFGGNNAGLVVTLKPGQEEKTGSPRRDPELWITSIGIVSTAGVGSNEFLRNAHDEKEISTQPPAENPVLLSSFDPRSVDRRLDVRGFDRASQFAAAAAWLCLADAGLHKKHGDRADLGLYVHCGHGPVWAEAEHITSLYRNDFHLTRLTAFPSIVPNSVAGNACRVLGCNGPNATYCLGPGAGLLGLGPVIASLRAGHGSIALSGATDEIVHAQPEVPLSVVEHAGRTPRVPAEGSVMLLIETSEHARNRGALPMGRLAGFCQTTDAEDSSLPDRGHATALSALEGAMGRAGISPGSIDVVCCDPANAREAGVLDAALPSWRGRLKGVPARFGTGETTGQLLDLSLALLSPPIEKRGPTYYILSLLCSPNGFNAACVIEAGFRREQDIGSP